MTTWQIFWSGAAALITASLASLVTTLAVIFLFDRIDRCRSRHR